MNSYMLEIACNKLVYRNGLNGNIRYPIVFVAGGRLYWYLNHARRAVFGTGQQIEMVDIRYAYRTILGREMTEKEAASVSWKFNQQGELFEGGRLFCDNPNVYVRNGKVVYYEHAPEI